MAKDQKVTRIKATDTPSGSSIKKAAPSVSAAKPAKKSATTAVVANADSKPVKAKKIKNSDSESKNVFKRIGGYFKGAWQELRVVRWPTRQATWSLTLAVILFSAFFVLLILALDAFFKYLFQLIIG